MSDKEYKINKLLYGKQTYNNSINTSFSHFLKEGLSANLDKFFTDYENIFFDIPKEGEINSHKYLISRSQEYLKNTFPYDISDFYNNQLNKQLLRNNSGQFGVNDWVIKEGILKSKIFDTPSLRIGNGNYSEDALSFTTLGYLTPKNFIQEYKKYDKQVTDNTLPYYTYLSGPDSYDDAVITTAYQDFNLSEIRDELLNISLEDIVNKNIKEVIVNGEIKQIKKVYPELFAWFGVNSLTHFSSDNKYNFPSPSSITVDLPSPLPDTTQNVPYSTYTLNNNNTGLAYYFHTDDEVWLTINFLDENGNLIEYIGIKNPSADSLPTSDFPEDYNKRSMTGNGIYNLNGGYIIDYNPNQSNIIAYNGIGGCPLPWYGNDGLINGFELSNNISHNSKFNMSNHFHDIPSNTKTIRIEIKFKRRGDYKQTRNKDNSISEVATGINSENSGRCSAFIKNIYFGLNLLFEDDNKDKIYYKPNKIYPAFESNYFNKKINEDDIIGYNELNNIESISTNGFINNNSNLNGINTPSILNNTGSNTTPNSSPNMSFNIPNL